MMDAGKGFMKDGNKNRLREQDIHKIVDVPLISSSTNRTRSTARMVSLSEIEEKEYNLKYSPLHRQHRTRRYSKH
jgi:type I restriction enzyme M protein